MKKRILSLLLVICLVMQALCMVTSAANTETGTVSQKVLDIKDFFVKLGVLNADFDVEDIATKASFLCMVLDATKVETVAASKQYFTDVPMAYYTANEIATGYDVGYIMGNGDGTFSPDKLIGVNEALAIVMNALNYGHLSGTSSYQTIINRQNLLKDVDIEADGTLKNGACIALIRNMLLAECNMLSGVVGDAGIYEADDSTNLLYELFSIIRTEGVVTAVDEICLDGYKKVKQGFMAINNVVIEDEEGLANDLLGFKVEAYVVEDESEYSLFQIDKATRGNDEFIIEAKDLTNKSTANKIVYINEAGKEKTIQLPKNYTLIYNGRNYSGFTNSVFHITQGKVRLVSNNGGDYTLVYIYEYENVVVKSVSESEEKIFLEDSHPAIDYSDTDDVVLLDAKGEPISAGDIYEGLVLTIFKSKGTPVFKTVQVGQGDYVLVPDGMDDKYIYAGQDKIPMTTGLIAKRNEIKMGTKTILLLDAFGEAVDFRHVVTDVMYGYLVDVEIEDDSFDEVVYSVKIFTQDNEMSVYKTEEYLKVNDARYKASEGMDYFMTNGVCVPQLVKFTASEENVLKEIWQYTDKSAVPGYTGYDEDNFTLDYVTGTRFQYRTSSGAGGVIDTKYILSGSTLRFIIPPDGNEKDYVCTNCASGLDPAVTSGKTYQILDSGRDRVAAVLLEVSSDTVSDFGNYVQPIVVDEISYGVNDEGTEVVVVSGYSQKNKVRYITDDYDIADEGEWCAAFDGIKVGELQTGDVIQVRTSNKTGEIYSMRILYRRSNPGAFSEAANRPFTSTDYYAYLYTTSAKVLEQYDNSIIVDTNTHAGAGAEPFTRVMPVTDSIVYYVYDSQRNKLTLTDRTEYIEGYNVFAALYLSAVRMIVVYK